MTTAAVPTPIRVGAYLTGTAVGLLGDPGIAYLGAEHSIDKPTAVFLGAVFGAVAVLTNALALSHLPLPTGPRPVRVQVAQPTAADLDDMRATVARAREVAASLGTDYTPKQDSDVEVVTEDPPLTAAAIGQAVGDVVNQSARKSIRTKE